MEFNQKDLINAFMNHIMQLKNTPEEELSELGKLSKLWADNFSEESFEKFRDYRNNLPKEEN